MAEKLNIEKIKTEVKNPKYDVDYATPNGDSALFLPSISSLYAKHVSKDDKTVRGGDLPNNMNTIKDLNFLDSEQGIYWYPWALYSAGHAQLDLSKTDIQESMIQKRNREHTFILADSGGYQLSTGVLHISNLGKPPKKPIITNKMSDKEKEETWKKYDDEQKEYKKKLKLFEASLDCMDKDEKHIRHRIMAWMEHTADFSMILDIPTTSCKNENSFIYNSYYELGDKGMFYKCLEYTVKNNAYFIKHRTPGKTKFLNVLQGRDINAEGTGENDIWYNVVKYFNNKNKCLRDVKLAYNEVVQLYNQKQPEDKQIGLFEIADGDDELFGERAFEGWAIPGNLKFDFPMLMRRFKTMYDEGYFEDTGETLLIHFLGISRVSAGLLYTTLQNELRRNINPNVVITYDAASPFVCTAKGKGYGTYTVTNEKMTYRMDTLPDRKFEPRSDEIKRQEKEKQHLVQTTFGDLFTPQETVDATDPNTIPIKFSKSQKPWHTIGFGHKTSKKIIDDQGKEKEIIEETTLGSRLVIGDICYKTWEDNTSSFWDGTSYVFIMNMNVEQHIRAIQQAHLHWGKPTIEIRKYLPAKIVDGKVIIEDIVRSKFDFGIIKQNDEKLDKILGMSAEEPDYDFNFEDAIEENDDAE